MNTSPERVDAMMGLSRQLYEVIDRPVSGISRAQHIMNLGINSVGYALRDGISLDDAGRELLALFHEQLERGGLTIDQSIYDPWPEYRAHVESLPRSSILKETGLNTFAKEYGNQTRGTLTLGYEKETNARHAVHLMGWSVPYAMGVYPRLNPNHVGVYDLFHDGIEAITGDHQTLTMSAHRYEEKVAGEIEAMPKLRQLIGPEFTETFELVEDYEALKEPAQAFTKSADKIDAAYTHFDNAGYALWHAHGITSSQSFRNVLDVVTERIRPYAQAFPELMEDRDEFMKRIIAVTKWPH